MFKKAERRQVKLKIALTGPSGAGKTYSALLIAKGLAKKPDGSPGKIALADTENGSGALYAGLDNMPLYDHVDIHSPFHTSKYMAAIASAVKGGYDVLIIDSITHQWAGEGGIMDRKDKEQMAKPSLNSYTLWAKYTPEHESFKQAIVQAPIHIIATIRSKQDYVIEQNDKGKSAPRKVGMAPVQREQFEYEFTTVLDLSMEHYSTTSKDRTHLFDGDAFRPTEDTGTKILKWTMSGAEPLPPPVSAAPRVTPIVSPAAVAPVAPVANGFKIQEHLPRLGAAADKMKWTKPGLIDYMKKRFQKDIAYYSYDEFEQLLYTVSTLTEEEAVKFFEHGMTSVNPPVEDPNAFANFR